MIISTHSLPPYTGVAVILNSDIQKLVQGSCTIIDLKLEGVKSGVLQVGIHAQVILALTLLQL